METVKAQRKFFAFIRARRAARPKRSMPKRSMDDWIALTIARGLSLIVVGSLVYVTYIVEMTGYNDFRRCDPTSSITRIQWVLGFRPAEDCRRL